MRRALLLIAVFVVLLGTPFLVRYLQVYDLGGPQPAAPPQYDPSTVAPVPTPVAAAFVDAPDAQGRGIVLLDQAHGNEFTLTEISPIDGLLSARGYRLLPFTEGDLAIALRPATALVILSPTSHYTQAEILAIEEFVARGGRLLLAGDPTRFGLEFDADDIFALPTLETSQDPLNDLANQYDITFRGDYLYNTVRNEGNFRNILLDDADIVDSELTEGLQQLAFYSSHSLQLGPNAAPILAGDADTWSSATDRPGGLVLAASGDPEAAGRGQVLALGDVHFLTNPYTTVYDNSALTARVADYLTGQPAAVATLASFPYFYDAAVDLVYLGAPDLGPDAFDDVIGFQSDFRSIGTSLGLAAEPDADHDVLYLGLYNQAEDVAALLADAGVELVIDPPVEPRSSEAPDDEESGASDNGEVAVERVIVSPAGRVQMAGTALLLLAEDGGRNAVVALSASNQGLQSAIDRLREAIPLNGVDLSDCLLQGNVAYCPTGVQDEPVEYELDTSGPPGTEAGGSPDSDAEPDDEDDEPSGDEPDRDADDQGSIEIGELVSADLPAETAHAWTFAGGPAVIDIILKGDEELDPVLELYDPDGELIDEADATFVGGTEELTGIDIPDDADYTIVVRDFFDDGGSYELSVSESGSTEGEPEETDAIERIFVFADDDGEADGAGETSLALLTDFLSADYDVTGWSATDDGSLADVDLEAYQLVFWDSGNFRDETGLFGDDADAILAYLDGGGHIVITGTSPTLFGPVDLAPLEVVQIVDDDELLASGFEDGELLQLDRTYQVATTDVTDSGTQEVAFLVRGPDEAESGAVVGIAALENGSQRTILLFAPLFAFEDAVADQLLGNMMAWLSQ